MIYNDEETNEKVGVIVQTHGAGHRSFVVTSLFTLLLLMLLSRLAQMQVLQHDQFSREALAQRFHTVRLDAPRGEILDRNGQKLATSRSAYRLLLLYPAYASSTAPRAGASPLLGQLAGPLRLDPAELRRRAEAKIAQQRFFEPFLVKDDLSAEELTWLTELKSTLPGIYIDAHPVRYYPGENVAAHLLGHVGEVNARELQDLGDKGYRPGDRIGKTGLEFQYEEVLRGIAGSTDLEVDAGFRPTNRSFHRDASQPGATISTTLDLPLQRVLDQSLARTLDYVRTHPDWEGVMFPHTNAGAAVVMDVKTGGILAMSSYPAFNPNLFSGVQTAGAEAAIRAMEHNRLFPLYNRAIGGEYLPGSTWKMVSAAAALENRVISADEHVFCGGVFDKLEPKKDWKPEGHGPVNTVSALANSCNIYFYEMGYRLGIERLTTTAARFGFGQALGIDLPGESEGWIPDEAAREQDPDPGSWAGGKLLSAAIGQGPTVTPLQLARYVASIANGGIKVRPHVASALLDSSGQVIRSLVPPPDGRMDLQEQVRLTLVDGMKAVTAWGTSAGAFSGLPFEVGGKTGTAEVVGPANCEGEALCQFGVYVAFAPADNPEIAVAVVGERAGHGDSMNPVARAVLAQFFKVRLGQEDPLYEMGIWDRPANQMTESNKN